MYVTASYLGVTLGTLKYLFFLLTEDHIEGNETIAKALRPALIKFGRELGDSGAIVRPFDPDVSRTFEEVLNRGWNGQMTDAFSGMTPGLLVIDKDFGDFDPNDDQYLFVSFREVMDEHGRVRVFELNEVLSALVHQAKAGSVFERVEAHNRNALVTSRWKRVWRAIELRPGVFGFSVDLKELNKALR